MIPSTFDVAIAGGGPGGSATAISLLHRAPSLSVVLIEATRYDSYRVGETLPPPARAILEHLRVWEAFKSQGHDEAHGTSAAWGEATPRDNDFFYLPANIGWHLDRTAFDAMLANEAQRRGATLILDTRVRDAQRTGKGWRLQLSNGNPIIARFVVDATGSAGLARRYGARFVDEDCLVGIAGLFDGCNGDPRTQVEAFEQGWWYTAGLPESRRIVVCMSDADVARRMRLHEVKEWLRMLVTMPNVGATVGKAEVAEAVIIRSASSRRLEPVTGDDWLAAGDSASRFDPLSSQGIVKALRSGIFASYAISDLLERGDHDGLKRYSRYVCEEFKSYSEIRQKYYREEKRWPASEFWLRRQGTIDDRGISPTVREGSAAQCQKSSPP
jgi:flavin-dependent dehydrogenase